VVRYSFPVGLFHSLLHAGLSRRTDRLGLHSLPSRESNQTALSLISRFVANLLPVPALGELGSKTSIPVSFEAEREQTAVNLLRINESRMVTRLSGGGSREANCRAGLSDGRLWSRGGWPARAAWTSLGPELPLQPVEKLFAAERAP